MTSKEAMWIGPTNDVINGFEVGMTGFLIHKSNSIAGWDRYEIRDTPAHTNQSHKPRLKGWCGTYNDVATYGAGMVRVERVARNGRAFVRQLAGDDLEQALEELGYPDLTADD